ncbi:hypothetical protein GCM10010264_38070 [Streptomyces globisporus]|nr:hypothetical protein GCM10010264_38070 [Streptomyces globisporus]
MGDGELLDPLCRDGVVHAVTGDDDELVLGDQHPGHGLQRGAGEVAAQVVVSREGQRLGQMGCGRTSQFFSFEPTGIVPDIICLSKAISGSGMPMALTLLRPQYDRATFSDWKTASKASVYLVSRSRSMNRRDSILCAEVSGEVARAAPPTARPDGR